jgi:hypothetical protein
MRSFKLVLFAAAAFASGSALAQTNLQLVQAAKPLDKPMTMPMDKPMTMPMDKHMTMPKMSRSMMRAMSDAKERETTKQLNEQQLHKH